MTATSALDQEGQLPGPVPRRAGRTGSVADALELLDDGSLVYVAPLMGTPTSLVDAMAQAFDRWTRLATTGDYYLEPLATFARPDGLHDGDWPFRHVSVQPSRATAVLPDDRLSVVAAHSSSMFRLYRPGGPLSVDAALVQVSEPGPDGKFSLGVLGGAALEIVCTAPVVIAEVNPRMPYTPGPAAFDRHAFDLLVEVEHELVTLDEVAQGPSDATSVPSRIAAHLAPEIPEGATIEYGIGAIPDAALYALANHRRLGLHSGLIGDAAATLIDTGAMDGSAKTFDAGLHVASAAIGSQRLVDWLRGRNDIIMVASSYSHAVPVLARHDRFVAINSAIEVALDGSVNAEQIGARVVSGPGGQPDFAAGALLAGDGLAVVALPSTARGGSQSRLVSRLDDAAPTTIPRYLADRVVTEFGVAHLRGADRAQRANRLAAVAHPDFESALRG